ncbi:MAG: NAD(P)/FAD-dependent oxidoreductase [Aestuariibaculum sp.]
MQIDYLIVGLGLAGISFCEQLKAHNKSFVVFSDNSQQSSQVAGGLYNPVVLKRFTPVWKCEAQLELLSMYSNIEKEFNIKLDYKIPVYRRFASLEEQNDWFTASDKPVLSAYMSVNMVKNSNYAVNAPFGFGQVLKTGRIDIKTLIDIYEKDLQAKSVFYPKTFHYDKLQIEQDLVAYGNIKARHIVFAEGSGIRYNPYFKALPLRPAKGELLIIHAPKLKMDYVLKANVFLIPLGNDRYIVGTTYNWENLNNNTSKKAKEELVLKLEKEINCDFKIENQVAGVRPTVKDRRPLVGRHVKYKNLYVLNGLGTRGVMIGPYVAKQLYNFIENDLPLDDEINIARFTDVL